MNPVAILKALDLAATLDWYRCAGFAVTGDEVVRGGLVLRFLDGDTPWPGPPSLTGCFYVHVADVDAVAEELRGRVEAPWGVEDREWGAREVVLRDPNGYFVTFTAGFS